MSFVVVSSSSRVARSTLVSAGTQHQSHRRATHARVSHHCVRTHASTSDDSVTRVYTDKKVVVTRELGKNGALMNVLKSRGVTCLEMPLIEAVDGEDLESLPEVLLGEKWDWVCVTSPEAAKVFIEGYEKAGKPSGVRCATVGVATGKVLATAYPDVFALDKQFIPSKATAATLVKELPCDQGSLVLYPASKKAATTLEEGLESRGATVVRLNTYSTEPVENLDPKIVQEAVRADVVTFGSPSAVRAWVDLCGGALYEHITSVEGVFQPAYVCIGETSAEACANCELPDVFYPENPGMDGWAETVFLALDLPTTDRWGGLSRE